MSAGAHPTPEPAVTRALAEQFFGLLQHADREAAIALVRAELERGVTAEDVMLHLLVPCQLEVGRRWQEGGWSVAQEHLATSCTEAVLTVVSTHIQARRQALGKVVVTCVEEEWHTLPSRFFAELLHLRGWRPTFLGAAIPTDSLVAFLGNAGPDAVALSCSVAKNLTGAASCIDAAHSLGFPVIVGGRGFGCDDRRARALGADAWAADLEEACGVLARWSRKPPALAQPVRHLTGEDRLLEARRQVLAQAALARLKEQLPGVAALDAGRTRRLEQDLAMHLHFVEAALVTGDPSVYLDFITWGTWLAPGVAPMDGLTEAMVKALAEVTPPHLGATAGLLGRAQTQLLEAGRRAGEPQGGKPGAPAR
jgi:methanogenic corrinoid protein MtbC1